MRSWIGFLAIACVIALGCTSKDDGGAAGSAGSGTGGSAGGGTGGSAGSGGGSPAGRPVWDEYCASGNGQQTCPGSTLYGQCVIAQCDAQNRAAYGDGYVSHSYTGPCASLATCKEACPCDATFTSCYLACRNGASAACLSVLQTAENCLQSAGCLPGICYAADAAAPTYTCKTLNDTCCWQVGEVKKRDSCYVFAQAGNDPACAAAYGSLQLDSLCP